MPLDLQILEVSDMLEIHDKGLGVLETVGIKLGSRQACQALEDIGATVDWDQLSVKIPRDLVDISIHNAPMDFTLAAQDPDRDIYTGDTRPWYTAGGQCPWFTDRKSGQRRHSTLRDLEECARLIDCMDSVDEWSPMVVPHDLPAEIIDLASMNASFKYSRKHFLTSGTDPSQVPYYMELVDAYLGDRKFLKVRPLFTYVLTTNAPLQIDGDALDKVLAWSDYQIPIMLQFLPVSGHTSPVTLAGTMVQATATFLGLVTLFQTISSGWPIIWGADAGVLDLDADRALRITPETVLMEMGFIQMAKELYQVPASIRGHGTEAHEIGFTAGLEAAMSAPLTELAGADNVRGIAELDGHSLIDLDYVVLANELIRWMERIREGINVGSSYFRTEVITEMGFRSDFLSHSTSAEMFAREHSPVDLFPKTTYEGWLKNGKSEQEIARQRVDELIAAYEPIDHPTEVLKEADRILAAAQKNLTG